MRHEIKKLYTSLKATMVYVTHDQIEAMSLASKIAVMNQGIIQQLDDPQTIYDKPNSLFVADFIGSPSMNFIKGEIKKDSQSVIFTPNNENNINFSTFGKPMRYLLTNHKDGPSLSLLISILGKETTFLRINNYLSNLINPK